jgi:acetyl esterase/lipase
LINIKYATKQTTIPINPEGKKQTATESSPLLPKSLPKKITIPSTISKTPCEIHLYIYTTPSNPFTKPNPKTASNPPYPVLLNLHGGGFTIGHATDDARWCITILKAHPKAISISIKYRLPLELPFPTAVEDSVDAIL